MCEMFKKKKKTEVFSFRLMMYICSFFAICVFICKYRKINKILHTIILILTLSGMPFKCLLVGKNVSSISAINLKILASEIV